jgi:hypothetical protein
MIEIPKRLKKRPMFHGIPIPFSAFIRPDGTPDFKVTNQKTWRVCVVAKRCGLCGEKLVKGEIFFIGGERSMETGCFYDPPMHRECADYAFKVCPFLACAKGYSKAPVKPQKDVIVVTDPNMPAIRPNKMGILHAKSYHMMNFQGSEYFQADDVQGIEWKD